jgi:WD40 repeat protein
MTRVDAPESGFDTRIADWLAADPDKAPPQVLHAVVMSAPSIAQRGRVRARLGTWGVKHRTMYLALAAIAAALLGAVAVGSSMAPDRSDHLVGNGRIAIVTPEGVVLIDPATGRTVADLIPPPTKSDDIWQAAMDLSWAPDGRQLAYSTDTGISVLDLATASSRDIRSCRRTWCTIAWAPDGTRILVEDDGGLELLDPDGMNVTKIPLEGRTGNMPTWSPDGRRIALSSGHSLYLFDRDGSNLTELVDKEPGLGAWDPAWSPDGSTIAYIRFTKIQDCPTPSQQDSCDKWHLQAMSVPTDGSSEPMELAEIGTCWCLGSTPGLAWSPDGSQLAIVATDGLSVMRADGANLHHVAQGGWGSPAWEPVP